MADYLFESARVRALETAIVGRERTEQLLQCKSVEDMLDRLREWGVELVFDTDGKFLREETLSARLRKIYAELEAMLPHAKELELFRYQYDCNNVKAAIKGFFRKIDPRSMMFDFGTVPLEDVIRMVQAEQLDTLPQAMRNAAGEAMAAYAKSRNPQQIDLLLDRACFADMLAAAGESRVAFVLRLVKEKIDLLNLTITVRMLRRGGGAREKSFWQSSLIDGGLLSHSYLSELYDAGEDALWSRLYYTSYGKISEMLAGGEKRLTDVERCADNLWMSTIAEAKLIPYGSEVLIAFLLAHEYEIRNLRILFAGKETGLPVETIRERIRDSYV